MTVQEAIDELSKISDKSQQLVHFVPNGREFVIERLDFVEEIQTTYTKQKVVRVS